MWLGNLVYLQQVKEMECYPKLCLPKGRFSQCLHTLFGKLHIDFFFAVGYPYPAGFCQVLLFTATSAKYCATF